MKHLKDFKLFENYEDTYGLDRDDYDDDDEYNYAIEEQEFEYNETFGDYDDDNIFYHGTTNKSMVGTNGIHLGSYKASKEALEARIGIPAIGEWDGTRKYGETLLKGTNNLGEYNNTGYNCGNDISDENYLPTDRKVKAKYSDGKEIPIDSYPIIFKVEIIGDMEEEIISDEKANKLGNSPYSHTGYYYKNIAEDEGSISAVVPNNKWLKIL